MFKPSVSIFAAVAVLVAACGGGGSGASPTASAAGSAASGAQRVQVTLADSLTMSPAAMSVRAGVPVTFVVTNSGAVAHEFYLGDSAAQDAHDMEMTQMGGMMTDEADGISVAPGQTKELTHMFATAGMSTAGCHVQGHYASGMKASISVTP